MSDRPRIPPSLTPRDAPVSDEPWPEPEPQPEPPREPRRRPRIGRIIGLTLLWTFVTLFVLAMVPPGYVLWLRWHAPPTSAFMLQSEVQPVEYHWVPAAQIPEALRKAVVASEDQKFYTHWGFDFMAIAEALEHNEKSRKKRGASTISQQTAKNLFLWPSRSWVRKGLEVTFTLLLEGLWPKDRILEVYLNIAEFGPGVYGVDAAAQHFFHKGSDELSAWECAQLAAVLPNPRKWRADRPGPYVQTRVDWILGQIGERPRFAQVPEIEPELPPESAAPGDQAEPVPAPETTGPEGTAPAAPAPAPDTGEAPAETAPAPTTPSTTPDDSAPPEETPPSP